MRQPSAKRETVASAQLQSRRVIDLQDRRAAPGEVSPVMEKALLAIRSALLMAVDSIADYLGKPKRARERD